MCIHFHWKVVYYLLLIFSCISTENINAEYLVNLSVYLLLFSENSVNMPTNFSTNNEHCINAFVRSRLVGKQAAEDQQYIKQQRTRSTSVNRGLAILYIVQCTSVSRGPAVHQLAEDQQYCASVSRGPAVHKSAEDQQYISQQRTSST